MTPRRSTVYFTVTALLLGAVVTMVGHAWWAGMKSGEAIARTSALVRSLQLTDLCLFPEANYTRHLSQADGHAAFQDAPGALEHFPSGSLAEPPERLKDPDRAILD